MAHHATTSDGTLRDQRLQQNENSYEREPGDATGQRSSTSINIDKDKPFEDHSEPHPNLVDWEVDDPERPINWTNRKKCLNLSLVFFFRFLTSLASSMVAPVTPLIESDLDLNSETIASFIVSIFILGYAVGPLVISPLSEVYGRRPLYWVNNVLFTCWNLSAALSPTWGAVLAFRLLGGLAGSCSVTSGSGSIADCVKKERRGLVTTIFSEYTWQSDLVVSNTIPAAGPLIGPCIGPIVGGYLSAAAGWRWVFWLLTIASGVGTIISFIVQTETFEPVLLERRTEGLRKSLNRPALFHRYTDNGSWQARMSRAIVRPVKMLCTSPIVLLTSLYVGLVYAYTYLLFTSFPFMYKHVYGFGERSIGLTYLGCGVGFTIGLVYFGAWSDRNAKKKAQAGDGEWKPEYRLPPILPGSLAVPIGLFWYGWSAEAHLHWIMPVIGTGIFALGNLAIFLPVQTYLIDAFEIYSASAAVANTLTRSLIGAFLPLAGPRMYSALGQGWGNSLLAFIALAFAPLGWIIYRYGERIRKAYPVQL
jgi:MFS family permease